MGLSQKNLNVPASSYIYPTMTDTNVSTKSSFYPHPSDNIFTTRILYREQCLRKFSAHFRDDPEWASKLNDPVYFNQKLRGAKENDKFLPRLNTGAAVWSDEDTEFVWTELVERYRPFVIKNRKSGKKAEPSIDGVWKTNGLVEDEVWRGLSQVILRKYSKRFCWLPSEFQISEEGKVKIASYINNLATEKQQELFYPILQKIFEGFVPLFNHVLADLREGKGEIRRVRWDSGYSPENKDDQPEMAKLRTQNEDVKSMVDWGTFSKDFELEPFIPPSGGSGDVVRNPRERLAEMWTPPQPEILESVKLEGRTVKVIVKMMHIVISPKKPWYTGEGWRVDGTKNERIVASGIYCYHQENITEFGLSFRRGFAKDPHKAAVSILDTGDDTEGFFDIEKHDTCQDIGNVELGENQGIAFPNIYHHRGWACCLRDESKPGYIKLLQFLLCDPSEEFTVDTTRTVPAQQPEIREERINAFREACVGRLPMELIYEIEEHIPPSISRTEATEYYQKVKEDGREWTDCILRMGGDAAYYVQSKPTGTPFDMISTATSYEWTPFTTRW
ncbi:hypothetical protein TWF191_001031 [Orbilia oligospora]|uniref:Uncharacterized protein n=1 Tax=Orbilia oligospora TaxID=2813651 RepID=A0A7C8UAZ2_ORBOL|nr:hypothetical protein TWF191_001031 [Orbilia oligospora]